MIFVLLQRLRYLLFGLAIACFCSAGGRRLSSRKNRGHFVMQDQADEFVGAVSEFAKPIAQKSDGERPTNFFAGLARSAKINV